MWGKFGKINVKQKISDLGLIQKRSFLDDLQFRKNFFIKSYDIPYIYYSDWLKRENFKSKLDIKKKIELPISNKDNVYALQLRPKYKNDIGIKDQIPKSLYDNFILKLVKKIKEDDKNLK